MTDKKAKTLITDKKSWQSKKHFRILFNTSEHDGIGRNINFPMPKEESTKQITKIMKEMRTQLPGGDIVSSAEKLEVVEVENDYVDAKPTNKSKNHSTHDRTTNQNEQVLITGDEEEEIEEQSDEGELLTLPNGVQLTFGQILALAGDYYAVPGKFIVDPKSLGEGGIELHEDSGGRRERFLTAYDTLGRAPRDKIEKQLAKLLTMIQEEDPTSESYKGHLHSDKQWDEATGGHWVGGIPLSPGRMLELAVSNYDHFQPHAKHAYLAGHQLAIEKAQEAGKEKDFEKQKMLLMEAYSIDAFAGHFLTDSFSSGHVRTPRVELGKSTTPSKVGDLLSKYMHDEDNMHGLRVTNTRGDKWICYGDGKLMKPESKPNFQLVVETAQISVNQVHEAFKNPDKDINSRLVMDLVPFIDGTAKNNSPLFQMISGKLHRRSDVSDLQDTKTKTNWWGTTTVTQLQFYEKKNSAMPPIA